MKYSVYDELVRAGLKKQLSSDDRARIDAALAAHPELREQWESDASVADLLRSLPDVPVSSNFTARVMDEIERADRSASRETARVSGWRRWLQPRLAWPALAAALLALGVIQYRDHQRMRLAHDVSSFSRELAVLPKSVPGPEIFTDFDAIEHMRKASSVSLVADDDLLKVLQQ